MKRHILAAVIAVIVISGLVVTVKPLAFSDNGLVNGAGTLVNGDGSRSPFTFNVTSNSKGKVSGQASIHNPSFKRGNGQNNQVNIDVTCLKVVGNVAIIGGMTKRQNSQSKAEAIYFAIQDGDPDKIFRGFYFDDDSTTEGDPQRCQTMDPDVLVFEPIATGSIQVKAQ